MKNTKTARINFCQFLKWRRTRDTYLFYRFRFLSECSARLTRVNNFQIECSHQDIARHLRLSSNQFHTVLAVRPELLRQTARRGADGDNNGGAFIFVRKGSWNTLGEPAPWTLACILRTLGFIHWSKRRYALILYVCMCCLWNVSFIIT